MLLNGDKLKRNKKMNNKKIARRGLMFVLSSPSGAGKTTLCQNLLKDDSTLTLSISVTTRQRRDNEIDGNHYHFISQDEFMFQRDKGDLLEWAKVHGHYYGTPKVPVQQAMANGKDMLFDIDWQGAEQLMQQSPMDIVSVFILPPSMQALESRLNRRAQDSAEVIAQRLANARTEISHWQDYDYIIINDDLALAFEQLQAILHSERLRRGRLAGLPEFVNGLIRS